MTQNQQPLEVAIRPSGEVSTKLITHLAQASWWLTKAATNDTPADFEIVVRGAGPNIKDALNDADRPDPGIRWE